MLTFFLQTVSFCYLIDINQDKGAKDESLRIKNEGCDVAAFKSLSYL